MMIPEKSKCNRVCETGNAFIVVLLGVVLFAALMFTFSRSARQGGENMGEKQREIAISDILSYAQMMERATNRVMLGGNYSESDIDFDNDIVAGYTNAACGAQTECKVFDVSGGAVSWQNPPDGFSGGNNWVISGANAVPDIGSDAAADLVLLLPGLSSAACQEINERLDITTALPQDADDISTTQFTGVFANTERIGLNADLSDQRAGCIQNTTPNPDEYVFYHVLWER